MARSRNAWGDVEDKEFGEQRDPISPSKGEAEELSGKLRKDNREDKLMHTVLNADKEKIEKVQVLTDALNNNISSFTPDMTYEQLVKNYRNAKKLFGETLIRELTGYDSDYVEKNVNIPEFRRELKEKIKQNTDNLVKEGLLNQKGFITEQAYNYSALAMLSEELDELEGKGLLGEKESKKTSSYGDRQEHRNYRAGDKYKDLSWKKTLNKAMRREHKEIIKEDLTINERHAKGKINIVYALDNSGSMKGERIKTAKKAGIALAYKATKHKDKTGLVIFNSKPEIVIEPDYNFQEILLSIAKTKTTGETDIAKCLERAIRMFKSKKETNHVILITDALQTKGKKPEEEVLQKTSIAANNNISISVIGINMDSKGEELAKKIADISKGTLYKVKSLAEIDGMILEDYYKVKSDG